MKIKYLILIIFVLISSENYFSQSTSNSDVIILLDNSGSIDDLEFPQMKQSTDILIQNLISCKNRTSVVHYATDSTGIPKIYIESDFTNDIPTGLAYSKRLSGGDYLHEAIGSIASALDNINSPSIVSPQKTLNKNPQTPLVIFVFTDAFRSTYDSYLVNVAAPAISNYITPNNDAFINFTNFKNNRNTTFVIVHVSPEDIANNAAAGIASVGGNYYGPVEEYPADPGYSITPRLYYPQSDFILSSIDIHNLTDNICSIRKPAYIDYLFEPMSCFNSFLPQTVYGNYSLSPGTSLVNISLAMENISTGISYPVSSPVNILSGSEYSFNINQSNFDSSMLLSGQYIFKISMTYNDGISTSTIPASSLYSMYYIYDVNFDCCSDNYDLYITSNVLPSNTDSQSSNGNIFANNTINNNANAVYHAANSVVLTPGFNAEYGSYFNAFIQPCVDPSIDTNYNFRNFENSPNNQLNNRKFSVNKNTISYDEKIKISPNPASTFINIDSGNEIISSWEMYDLSGKIVLKGNSKYINIESLPKANYLLKININNKTITKKVIVK